MARQSGQLARRSINIKEGKLIARVNAEIRRRGSRLSTTAFAATLIEEALAARSAKSAVDLGGSVAATARDPEDIA
jgi:hypothetical protein